MNLPPDKWLSPPEHFDWENGDEVHLWRIDLNRNSSAIQSLFEILSPDERQRAEKYHFEADKKHFIISRAALREILSRYLDTAPGGIRFSYNRYGKPAVSAEKSDNLVQFNVSRSREIALCAVTRGRVVGVDIEFINEDSANMEIAGRFFSTDEIAALQDVPAELKTAAFFSCWTRKEAYIKAIGQGLSSPLREFTASVIPYQLNSMLITDDNGENRRWSSVSFSPHPNYIAALAIEGKIKTLLRWQWSRNVEMSK